MEGKEFIEEKSEEVIKGVSENVILKEGNLVEFQKRSSEKGGRDLM